MFDEDVDVDAGLITLKEVAVQTKVAIIRGLRFFMLMRSFCVVLYCVVLIIAVD